MATVQDIKRRVRSIRNTRKITRALELVAAAKLKRAQSRIEELEQAIDRMEEQLTPLRSFILPGGSLAASNLHVARTVCRRAERLIVALEDRSTTLPYLNRLADYLFVAARFANLRHSVADIIWNAR